MFIQIKDAEELLPRLSKIPQAVAAHGEASFGYSFELKDGSKLVIGQTDSDVSEKHLLWIHLINKPVETTKEQPKYYISEEDLNMQHEMASQATRSDEYREGYLDAYNRFKRVVMEG